MNSIMERDKQYISNTYNRFPVTIVRGKGATGYDENGKEYIDFGSGIGVNCLGFSDQGWADAVCKQVNTMQHVSNLYYTLPDGEVAEKICKYTGFSKIFFGNSGAEANECALKIARKYGAEKHGTECMNVITLNNSFHGRTITTLAATGQDVFHKYFLPLTDGFRYVDAGDMAGLHEAVDDTVCGIMLELVQGEGGVVPVPESFVKEIERICKEKDLVFIIDEIQTGVSRTGTFLCYEQYGVEPDVVTLAKGLGGGLPIGGILMSEKVSQVLGYGLHGSTFGGNPVACAGASYVLDQVTEPAFLEEVNKKAAYIKDRLLEMPEIVEVSGLGLMMGAELSEGYTAGEIAKACAVEGALILTAKTRLRFLPPLTITYEEIDKGLAVLKKVLAEKKPE